MSISTDDLKYRLVRGLPIEYNGLIINQPKISDIDKMGISYYSSMVFPFCIQKEHLQLWDTLQDVFSGKSLFQSIFIQEKYYIAQDGDIKLENSIIRLLADSLCFFLNVELNDIEPLKDDRIIINYKREFMGKIFNIPFELNDDNFEEFSELIRTITWNEKYKIKKEENKRVMYDDPNIQKIYEDLLKAHDKEKEEEEQKNNITISDVIGAVSINENTKYKFNDIGELTVWQLFYLSKSSFDREYIDITKRQYTSGNFTFDKPPDLNWLEKVRIKLPKEIKTKLNE